jgi:SseB protein N-terminal domain
MPLINWDKLFNRRKKDISKSSVELNKPVDINKPVENPDLKKAFERFELNKSENNLKAIINELINTHFLVLIQGDEMRLSKTDTDNGFTVEKGSKIKFLNCYDKNNKPLLPIFTDWQEVDLWLKNRDNNIHGWVMTANEAFDFAVRSQINNGVVINPGSTRWEMSKEHINNIIKEISNKK